MGGSESKPAEKQTEIKICLERECSQAGAAIRGQIQLVFGKAQKSIFQKFDQGTILVIKLVGEEKVYWAIGQAHTPNNTNPTKYTVDRDCRREENRTLIIEEKQLRQFSLSDTQTDGFTVHVPFSIPLPENLPSSFLYCGEMMSYISV